MGSEMCIRDSFNGVTVKEFTLGFSVEEENVVFYCDNFPYFEQPLERVSEIQLGNEMDQILYQKFSF